jgi:serine/threonine protein kinase
MLFVITNPMAEDLDAITRNTTGKELGRGAFGIVYATGPNGKYAAKHIGYQHEAAKADVMNEINTLTKLKGQPNILQLEHYVVTDYEIIILTLCYDMSLRLYIKRHKVIPPKVRVSIIRQLCTGLRACHQLNVVHLDIKSDNVLVREVGGEVEVVYGDFGLSMVAQGEQHFDVFERVMEAKKSAKKRRVAVPLENLVVTANYRDVRHYTAFAHEQFIDKSIDVWALGVTIAELYLHKLLIRDGSMDYIRVQMITFAKLLETERAANPKSMERAEKECQTLLQRVHDNMIKMYKDPALEDYRDVNEEFNEHDQVWVKEDEINKAMSNKIDIIKEGMEQDGVWTMWLRMLRYYPSLRPPAVDLEEAAREAERIINQS